MEVISSPIFKIGSGVDTPDGRGIVRRYSTMQKLYQVDVNGQLYEYGSDKLRQLEGMDVIKLEYFDGTNITPTTEVKPNNITMDKEKKVATKDKSIGLPDAFSVFLEQVHEQTKEQIKKTVKTELKEIKAMAKRSAKLEVKTANGTSVVTGLRHEQLEDLITVCSLRLPVLMVGMAGTGKTHAGGQVAEALSIPFYTMSVGAQTSKSDIIGYMNANGKYVKTFFRDAYENGGVFLMDEIDAGNANVLIQINAALSNDLCAFPDAMIKKHADFVFIATANTYGNGMNRQYVGRNQLDAATLDRFTVIDWGIDEKLEEEMVFGTEGRAWLQVVRFAREEVANNGMRALVTPRATLKGCALLSAGVGVESVVSSVILPTIPDDKKGDMSRKAEAIFSKETAPF